jgi:histidine ammonia-lyase
MGGFACRKAKTLYENISFILGIELMCCLQAVDLLCLKPSKKLMEIK